MNKTFYFMAGLPRSGSTLLSSILNQNPRFYSGPSSPVLGAMFAVEQDFMGKKNWTENELIKLRGRSKWYELYKETCRGTQS